MCRDQAIAHFDVALCSRELPSRELLVSLIDAFDAAPEPFLLKCSGGADRTSFAAALFVLHRCGWGALARADAQFSRLRYLHFPKPSQRWARKFIAYAAAKRGRAARRMAPPPIRPARVRMASDDVVVRRAACCPCAKSTSRTGNNGSQFAESVNGFRVSR